MTFNVGRFFRNCNPSKTLNYRDDRQYYIDFSAVRGNDLVSEMRRTIEFSGDEPTCQLFTGHIGCGKSTELSRLKVELEEAGYHVVFFESSTDLDMADVDISDILLAIARQISRNLEAANIQLQPTRFQGLLQQAADLLNSEVTGLKLKLPQVGELGYSSGDGQSSLSFGIGEIATKAKDSKDIRALLRQHLEPRVNAILELINSELLAPAQQQLRQQGKAGLVAIVDNLDRIDNKPKRPNRLLPEYLFADRGDQLNKLQCHVVYTIPLVLAFSNEKETLANRFGSDPQILPMVRLQNRDGSRCETGIAALSQMVLARAFPDLAEAERLTAATAVFDSRATLEQLCQLSGGHVRNLLVLLQSCLKKQDPPLTSALLDQVARLRCSELSKAVTEQEWQLLRQVQQTKRVSGEADYQTLLRSLFVFEYRDSEQSWFELNPILTAAKELADGA